MSDNTAREERLARINETLAALNLKPLADLGDHTHGEIELGEIVEIFDHSKRFFTDVQFSCTFPNGATGLYTIRWNANSAVSDGAVMTVIVNGRVAIVRQYRPAHGQWLDELPRGFGEELDTAKVNGKLGTLKFADLPLATMLRELGEEVLNSAEIVTVQHLGNIAQDSSTHTAAPAYWAIEINVDRGALKRRMSESTEEGIALKLWSLDKAIGNFGARIADAHSIVGLALYDRHVRSAEAVRGEVD